MALLGNVERMRPHVVFQVIKWIFIADMQVHELCQIRDIEKAIRVLSFISKGFFTEIQREDVM